MPKILAIEDEIDALRVLRKRLIDSGFEVVVSTDAYQGIEAAHREKPDLIILDLILPAGGGWSALKNIKASLHTRFIPIVVLTGVKNENLKDNLIAEGAEAYFEKPYDSKELIEAIKKILKI